MTRTIREIRILLSSFIAVLIVILFFSIKERPKLIEYTIQRVDPTAEVEITDTKTVYIGEGETSEIKAEQFFQYSDGRPSRIVNVSATITDKNNDSSKKISIEADEMKIYDKSNKERPKQIEWSGSVKTVTDGKIILANKLVYILNDKKYIFTGSPIIVIESCRKTTAEEVTIDRVSNTVTFKGKNQRTFSTFTENCEDKDKKEVSTTSFFYSFGFLEKSLFLSLNFFISLWSSFLTSTTALRKSSC